MVSFDSVPSPERHELMDRVMRKTPSPDTKKKQEEKKRLQKAIEREKQQEMERNPPVIPNEFIIPPRRLDFGQRQGQSGSGKRKRKTNKRKGKKKRQTRKKKGKKKKRSVKK